MKFTGQFTGIKLNQRLFLTRLQVRLKQHLFEAASSWIEGPIDLVPVWSGMALGSMLKAAMILGIDIEIIPNEKSLEGNRISLGEALGIAELDLGTTGSVSLTIGTQVSHYILQEFENVGVSKSAPWGSFAHARELYLARIKRMKPKLPQPVYQPVKIKAL